MRRVKTIILVFILLVSIFTALEINLSIPEFGNDNQTSVFEPEQEETIFRSVQRLVGSIQSENDTISDDVFAGGVASSIQEENDTHFFVIDPTDKVFGYWIEKGSGYQELFSSRGQTSHHYYNETNRSYRFQSDYLVNKTNIIEGTDWVTEEEYPSRYIIRLRNGTIKTFETPEGISNYLSLIDNSTIWAVGYESFEGIMGFYLNFQDTDWGHGQYLFWPRLKNGQISSYSQPLYAIYPHLYVKVGVTWYDKILNDRTLYTEPYQNPRNTLQFFNDSDEFGLYFSTPSIMVQGFTWDFEHGLKYNSTDGLFHMITRFRCLDRGFDDVGMGYEITSSPQSDGTPYQPDRFVLSNETYSVVLNISQSWDAGVYLKDYYSRIDIVSQNNDSFRFIFGDMEQVGFSEKYLSLHDQLMPDGSTRKTLRAGMYGYGTILQGEWIDIDPATGTLSLSDNFDLHSYNTGGAEIYSDGSDYVQVGKYYMSTPVVLQYTYTGFMMWDTQIEVAIIPAYTYSVVLNVYVDFDTVESGEGMKCRVYDIDGEGDGYTDHNAREDSLTYTAGTNYVSTGLVLTDPGTGAKTMDATNMELCTDYWATNRGDNENYIKFRFEQYGCDGGTDDYIYLEDFEDSKSTPATLAFSYYDNTAPNSPTLKTSSGNTYAGKSHLFEIYHSDDEGYDDIETTMMIYDYSSYDIKFKVDPTGATGSTDPLTAGNFDTGSDYVILASSSVSWSGSSDTYTISWTVVLDWDWGIEENTYDVYGRTIDDDAEDTGWIAVTNDLEYEDDLEVVTPTFTYPTANEYGSTGGQLDDSDWFATGQTLTITGDVEYEGSSQNFDSDYASGVSVQWFWDSNGDGTHTDQGDSYDDTDIDAGALSISFTMPSGTSPDVDTDADMDLVIQGVPTGGSDVTDAEIEVDLSKDDEDPTMTSIVVTGDGTVEGFEEWDQDGEDFSINPSARSDGSGSGVSTVYYEVGDSTPDAYNSNDDPYTYPVDVGDGITPPNPYTFYAMVVDNVGNEETVRSDDGYVDEIDPIIGTPEFQDEGYDAGTTCWYDQGADPTATYRIPFTETNVYEIVVICNLDGSDRAEDWSSGGTPFDSAISISGRSDTVGDQEIIIEIKDKSGRMDTTFTGDDEIGLDDTAPSITSFLHSDSNSGTGYEPQDHYDDDLTADYTVSGGDDGFGVGLHATETYRYEWNDGGYDSWTTSTSYPASATDGQSAKADGQIKDKVGNIGTFNGEDVVIDDDAPIDFTLTLSRHTGIESGYYAYLSGSTIYFNSGQTDYFAVQVNIGGTIGNSLYWKSEFDVDGVIDTKTTDTSGLPDSDDQYYLSAGSGTFCVRLVNNAGNYQEWNYTATEDTTAPTMTFELFQDTQAVVSNYYHTATAYTNVSSENDASSGLSANFLTYKLNDGTYGAWESTVDETWSGATDQDNNSLYAKIRDNVGNNASYEDWVFIDTIVPVFGWLTLNESYAPNWFDQSVSSCAQATILWTEDFPYDVDATCTLSHTDDNSPSGSQSLINFTLTGEYDGSYSVSIRIRDYAGNEDTTLLGSEAPIQLDSGMSTEAHIKEFWFLYYRSDGRSLDWKEFNTTYVLDEDYREYIEVLFLGVGVGRRYFNDTSSIRIITRDYFQEVLYNQSFALPSSDVKYIQLTVYTFKVASTYDGIINMTIERTSGSGSYDEQIMPYEIFRWDLHATTYNITALTHISGVYATDDEQNSLNNYQIDLSSNDVAIFIDASDPTIVPTWGEVVANDSTIEFGDTKLLGWTLPEVVPWTIWLNGTHKADGTSSCPQWTFATSLYSIDYYNLTLMVTSTLGATNTSYVRLYVGDTISPTITYDNSTLDDGDNVEWGQSYTLNYTFSEIVDYTMYRNDSSQTTGSGTSLTWTFDTSGLDNGYYYNITLKIVDGGLNTVTHELILYNSDTTQPSVTIGYSSKTVEYSAIQVSKVVWTVYDLHNYQAEVFIDGVSIANYTLSSSTSLVEVNVVMEIDTKLYRIEVYDSAGNYQSDTVTIQVTTAQEEGGGKGDKDEEISAWDIRALPSWMIPVGALVVAIAIIGVGVFLIRKKLEL